MAIGTISINPALFQAPITTSAVSFPTTAAQLPQLPNLQTRPAPVRPTVALPAGSFPMTSVPVFGGAVNGGGPVFNGSANAQALQNLFGNENPNNANFLGGTGSFFDTAIGMQFATGDLISTTLGMAQVVGGNGGGVNTRELTTNLQQTYGPLMEAESKLQEESVAAAQDLKKEIFADHHYEFDGNDQNPKLVDGKETVAQKAKRLAYERKQKIAAAQRVSASPQAAEQRRLSELVAKDPNNKGLLLQLDAANTALQVESMKANLAAELPVSAEGATATEALNGLRAFGESAITDWQGMHSATIQRLAADPRVDQLLAAQADQKKKLEESQAALAQASQQLLAQGQQMARPF